MHQKQPWQTYIELLHEELVPALGCTEPIAIAYAAALAAKVLGKTPQKLTAACSGNIIKNTKSVVVPNTGGLKGCDTAAVAGALAGDADRKLEVLTGITPDDLPPIREALAKKLCKVELLGSTAPLHIILTAESGGDRVLVEILHQHTNVVRIEKNGEILAQSQSGGEAEAADDRHRLLNLEDILDFADNTDLTPVREMLDRMIDYNTGISREGLSNNYGANIGKTLLASYGNDVKVRARASAAAGSDARMSGCELPVVINSGSGNQGVTASLPVIEYAGELGVSREKLHRALLVSNLVAILQKRAIGRLSAYCGAVSAACGSGAAITYLHTSDRQKIANTITNTLANVSGIVCDGAKPSCAAKIASSVDAALMGHYLAMRDECFQSGDGIVGNDIHQTIESVGRLAREGMRETDREVLRIMVEE